jgi:hypothetical protein
VPSFDYEKRQNWQAVASMAQALQLPAHFVRTDKAIQGNFHATYTLVVLLYCCHQLTVSPTLVVDFAHSLDAPLAAFVQSRACIECIARGGAFQPHAVASLTDVAAIAPLTGQTPRRRRTSRSKSAKKAAPTTTKTRHVSSTSSSSTPFSISSLSSVSPSPAVDRPAQLDVASSLSTQSLSQSSRNPFGRRSARGSRDVSRLPPRTPFNHDSALNTEPDDVGNVGPVMRALATSFDDENVASRKKKSAANTSWEHHLDTFTGGGVFITPVASSPVASPLPHSSTHAPPVASAAVDTRAATRMHHAPRGVAVVVTPPRQKPSPVSQQRRSRSRPRLSPAAVARMSPVASSASKRHNSQRDATTPKTSTTSTTISPASTRSSRQREELRRDERAAAAADAARAQRRKEKERRRSRTRRAAASNSPIASSPVSPHSSIATSQRAVTNSSRPFAMSDLDASVSDMYDVAPPPPPASLLTPPSASPTLQTSPATRQYRDKARLWKLSEDTSPVWSGAFDTSTSLPPPPRVATSPRTHSFASAAAAQSFSSTHSYDFVARSGNRAVDAYRAAVQAEDDEAERQRAANDAEKARIYSETTRELVTYRHLFAETQRTGLERDLQLRAVMQQLAERERRVERQQQELAETTDALRSVQAAERARADNEVALTSELQRLRRGKESDLYDFVAATMAASTDAAVDAEVAAASTVAGVDDTVAIAADFATKAGTANDATFAVKNVAVNKDAQTSERNPFSRGPPNDSADDNCAIALADQLSSELSMSVSESVQVEMTPVHAARAEKRRRRRMRAEHREREMTLRKEAAARDEHERREAIEQRTEMRRAAKAAARSQEPDAKADCNDVANVDTVENAHQRIADERAVAARDASVRERVARKRRIEAEAAATKAAAEAEAAEREADAAVAAAEAEEASLRAAAAELGSEPDILDEKSSAFFEDEYTVGEIISGVDEANLFTSDKLPLLK